MAADGRTPDSGPGKPNPWTDWLQTLIRSLQSLYAELSARLLESRLQAGAGTNEPRESAPIQDLLSEHIVNQVEGPAPTEQAQQPEASADTKPMTRAGPRRGPVRGARTIPAPVVDSLSGYFSRYRSSAHRQPFLRDRMRSNTLHHINKAISLAKAGNEKSARFHAKLAESAMKTAGQYMSDEEYSKFREEVEARMRAKGTSGT